MLLFDQDIQDPRERWRPWVYSPPPLNWLHLEVWRREWPGPRIVTLAEMHPLGYGMWNVAGLYWREV